MHSPSDGKTAQTRQPSTAVGVPAAGSEEPALADSLSKAERAVGWITAAAVFGVDRTMKILANAHVLHGGVGPIHLTLLHNAGAAGGSFAGHRVILTAVGILVSAALFLTWTRYRPRRTRTLFSVSWGLLFGAALGNTFDRAVYGYVTDMIHITGGRGIFNVADVCLQAGLVLLFIHVLLQPHQRK